jgi:hypothetical protein
LNRKAAILTGTAVIPALAVLAAPAAAWASSPQLAPSRAHTQISGWGHNRSGGVPVAVHGNSVTRHLTVSPGGVRTVQINDFTCHTASSGQYICKAKVIETTKTNKSGKITLTLPVTKQLHSYAVYVQETGTASSAETPYWGVYKA